MNRSYEKILSVVHTKLGCTLESGWIPFEPWTKNANHVATYTLQVRFLFMVRGGRTYFTFYGASNKRTTLIDTIQSSILNLDVVAWSNFNSLTPYKNFIQVIADTPCHKNHKNCEIKKNLTWRQSKKNERTECMKKEGNLVQKTRDERNKIAGNRSNQSELL